MRLCEGYNVARNREFKEPAPLQPSRERGAHLSATLADGWGGDGTACALAWLNQGVFDGTDERSRSHGHG